MTTPMKYRKKPVEIEAMLFDIASAMDVAAWVNQHLDPTESIDMAAGRWAIDPGDGALLIGTLEGVMRATPGDYIIRGVQGEFYPCKPDIFAETYDPVIPTPQLSEHEQAEVDRFGIHDEDRAVW